MQNRMETKGFENVPVSSGLKLSNTFVLAQIDPLVFVSAYGVCGAPYFYVVCFTMRKT